MSTAEALLEALGSETLPARPDPSLDPYLDAAEECVARYGWARLSPTDIARVAGVERTTVYRHLGPKRRILALVITREVHRLVDHATQAASTLEPGPEVVVEIIASAVEYARASPAVVALISDDDPELLASFFTEGTNAVIDRFVETLAPLVEAGTRLGVVADRDPRMLVDWAVRMGLSVFAHPPRRELRPFLAEVLLPVLSPATHPDQER